MPPEGPLEPDLVWAQCRLTHSSELHFRLTGFLRTIFFFPTNSPNDSVPGLPTCNCTGLLLAQYEGRAQSLGAERQIRDLLVGFGFVQPDAGYQSPNHPRQYNGESNPASIHLLPLWWDTHTHSHRFRSQVTANKKQCAENPERKRHQS